MSYKHILVTTDLSEASTYAFERAVHLAKLENSKITLLHIARPYELPPELRRIIWSPDNISRMENEHLEGCKKELKDLVDKYFNGLDIETCSKYSNNSSAKEICGHAKTNNCDLIIMSSQGHGAIGSLLLGSVTQKVTANADCPVLVVPIKNID